LVLRKKKQLETGEKCIKLPTAGLPNFVVLSNYFYSVEER
jgi:hypothetical protein